MSRRHTSQTIPHKIRLRVLIRITKDMGDCHRVGDHQSSTTEKSMIYECGPICILPAGDEVVILLVMHCGEVSH